MRALVYTGPGRVAMEVCERPRLADGEMEIAVDAVGVCGADVSGFLGRSRRMRPPLVMGHEVVGRTRDGRRVVVDPLTSCGRCAECRSGRVNLCGELGLLGMDGLTGGFAEFVAVREDHAHEIPEELDELDAVWTEPLANVVHLFRLAGPSPGFRMGIVGAGTMGSLALKLGLYLGASAVLVEEVNESRLEAARRMGATLAVHAESGRAEARDFDGEGGDREGGRFDVVLDACGVEAARQRAFDLCRPGGTVALLGMADPQSAVDFGASIRKEHRVLMSFGYTKEDFKRSLELIVGGVIEMREWTRAVPLEEGQAAFEQMTCQRGATLKMVLSVR